MGSKKKLRRFRENETFTHVIQPEREILQKDQFEWKGQWTSFFQNEHPIVLELGCGKGEYTVYLAEKHPDKNFIGIDIKGARFWRGAKTVAEKKIPNVAFIRAQIEMIANLFAAGEVAEIWITFPDPQIKFKRSKHRLTHPNILALYHQILVPQGTIHLKTDSEFLHGYTLGILDNSNYLIEYAHHDIYNNPYAPEAATAIQTFYEKMFLDSGKPITYLKFYHR